MSEGLFITFEGGEGCGKTSQMERLAARLREAGLDVVTTREPGGTPVGDRLRDLVLDPAHPDVAPMTELLIYEASRAQLVEQVIRPALERGSVVLCDRFADSSTAYQAYGRGLALQDVLELNELATGGLVPDRTILLDVDPEVGLERAAGASAADRLESEELEFHERVREGFLRIYDEDPDRVDVIGADGEFGEIATAIDLALSDLLP